ncbi:predicted protein [Nematostella vectensis]|uniref:Hemicentin-1-like von Willebrand factor A domain-containing protein n=1 Tax=Nematostella vectensis TaxID=45351 RepID=A7S2A9_NEMVE|nr:von Willebrand factor A domain-containing protein 7 [Nematostella vectensis]EDO42254.1 predicted protein [Nematostella vectensis]|eukprot:XP_001634317.1 predicted protein [Nematostella vectensis]
MRSATLLSQLSVLAIALLYLPAAQSQSLDGYDMFDFAKKQLNPVSEKVEETLHRVSGGGPLPDGGRPGARPRTKKRGPRGESLGNNRYVSAMLQVNKAMAEAQGRRLSFDPTFLKTVTKLAVDANEMKKARDALGFGMYEDFKKYQACMKSGSRHKCGPSSSGIVAQIRSLIGDEKFNRLMAVQGDADLIFTIDTTGSMSEEINAAKRIVESIARYDRERPVRYTLSPFNDPHTGPVRRYGDRSQFLRALDNLRATGGGDCKEMTFHGIYNAINETKPPIESPMFVFTDAGPKDESTPDVNKDDAIGKALDYFVPVSFFYSTSPGSCRKPSEFDSFNEIVDATEGMSMQFGTSAAKLQQMGEIVISALDGTSTVKSGRVTVSGGPKRRGPPGIHSLHRLTMNRRNMFPIDESISKFIVVITVERNEELVELRDPNNGIVAQTYQLENGAIWVVHRPRSGMWSLMVPFSVGSHSFKVTASSELNIDFDYYFIRRLPGNSRVEIPISEPLIGEPAIVKVLIPLANRLQVSSLRLDALDRFGNVLEMSMVSRATATFQRPPSVPFKLRLRGTTVGGFSFERISRKIITAKSAIIRMVYNKNYYTLPRGKRSYVRFAIHNNGASDTFRVNLAFSSRGIQIVSPPSASGYHVRSRGQRYVSTQLEVPTSMRKGTFIKMFVTARGTRSGVTTKLSAQLMVM